jgi:DNA polymerase
MQFLTLDFETRSEVSLKTYSTTHYATHPSTGILCIGLKYDDGAARTFRPSKGQPVLDGVVRPIELMHAIEQRLPIVVHNLSFEKRIYRHICVERWGWPEIPDTQWVDTVAICRYYALPAKLVDAAKALGLEAQKDMAGNRVMLQCSKPRRPRKAEIAKWVKDGKDPSQMPALWYEDEDRLARVYAYCEQDLIVQEQVFRKLGALPSDRIAEWRFDEMVNDRGVPVDWAGLFTASHVVEQSLAEFNQRLREITKTPAYPEGMVTAVTQRKKILDWCELAGWSMTSTDKEAVEGALSATGLPGPIREVLTIVREAGKSSLGKLDTMLSLTDPDCRIRDSLAWHGAATGRKAGRGMQPQNFPRDCMDHQEAEQFHALLREPNPYEAVSFSYQSTLMVGEPVSIPDVVSSALRSFIVAEPGYELFISDFSNIETRVLAWVAGCRLLNEAFSTGACPYRQFASRVYNVRPDTIAKGSQERQLGKVAVLGLGYGMGHAKFTDTAGAPPYNIALEMERSKEIVKLYRSTYPEVPAFWRACETAFMDAIQGKTQVQVGRVAFGCNGEWGWIIIPSGRPIWMREPKVGRVPDRWREGKTRLEITYMGIDSRTKQWTKRSTYGGSLTESICQGVAACLLQAALHRVESNGYPVVLSVHDEVVSHAACELPLERFHDLMKARPAWALDLPIECESQKSRRYGK